MMASQPNLAALTAVSGVTAREAAGSFWLLDIVNDHAQATIALQGAHLTHWQRRGDSTPVIWVSEATKMAHGASIRGGIPICWPWFGAHAENSALPGHGHARTQPWQLIQAATLADGSTELTFTIEQNERHQQSWPYPTEVTYRLTIGQELIAELTTHNRAAHPLLLSQALHTYFRVGAVESATVEGLAGCRYLDKVAGGEAEQQGAVTIQQEVDRIYLDTPPQLTILDPVLQRRLVIESSGSRSAVVWNPWQLKTERMGDLGREGYHTMLCVETANAATDSRTLNSGEHHTLTARYRVEPI